MDDVGATYDACTDKGVTITSTLGRHTNDRMTSFYMRTRSGFLVEYGHGGRLIDDERWENDWAADDYVPNGFGGDNSVVRT